MHRPPRVSRDHYAYSWSATESPLNETKEINALAIKYADLPDGPEKEETCLALLRAFDPYLRKYLSMILSGHLPAIHSPAGKDAAAMLRTLVPKGTPATREALGSACRSLHLAFKQNSTDDVYDTLVMCLMKAVRKYDPYYTRKVKAICEVLDERFAAVRRQQVVFSEADVSDAVGFDSLSYLRMLVRRGHLVSISGPKKKVVGYKRTRNWPPEQSFLESGPVGFVYFLPLYFRYYLHEYISGAMSSIESKEGMLQLDHRSGHAGTTRGAVEDAYERVPHAYGNHIDSQGNSWQADLSMINLPLDVSTMTMEWVEKTNDRLFRNMTKQERYLLFLIYVKELKWVEIAATLDCDTGTARKQYEQIMLYLKGHANARRKRR